MSWFEDFRNDSGKQFGQWTEPYRGPARKAARFVGIPERPIGAYDNMLDSMGRFDIPGVVRSSADAGEWIGQQFPGKSLIEMRNYRPPAGFKFGNVMKKLKRAYSVASGYRPPGPGPAPPGLDPPLVKLPAAKRMRRLRKSVRTYTTGYAGRASKRYRRERVPPAATHGAAIVQEKGSVHSATEVAMIGHHNAPVKKLLRVFSMGVIRKIAKQMHQDFNSWDDPMFDGITSTAKIRFVYKKTIDDAPASSGLIAYASGDTWRTFANKFADELADIISGVTRHFEMLEIQIVQDNAAEAYPVPQIKFTCRNMYINWSCSSRLTFQNQTRADEGAAIEHDDSSHITNNPLRWCMYKFNGNYLKTRWYVQDSALGNQAIYANNGNGIIELGDDDFATQSMRNLFLKLPPAHTFEGKVVCTRGTLQPGQILSSRVAWKRRMTVNGFFAMILDCVQNLTNGVEGLFGNLSNRLGTSEMVAFEKVCDTGATGGEPTVTVGYEINTYCSAVITGGRHYPAVSSVSVADS